MGILDKLRGRSAKAMANNAETYAVKRGVADGTVAIAEWARTLAFGDSDLTPEKGREFAAELVAAIENDEPLPTGFPRPFTGPDGASRDEIARSSLAQIDQSLDDFNENDRLGVTNGLAESYEAGFEVAIHTVLDSVTKGTFEAKFGRALESPGRT